jgi:hypothetical protein
VQVKRAKQRRVVYAPESLRSRLISRSDISGKMLVNVPREMQKHAFEIFAPPVVRE